MSQVDPNSDTQQFVYTPADTKRLHDSRTASVKVDVAGVSHKGMVRPRNQDHFAIARFERSLQVLDTNVPEYFVPQTHRESAYGIVVADGMGGPAAGDIASRLAIRTLVDLVINTPDWIMRAGEGAFEEVMRRQEERFAQIKETLTKFAETHPFAKSMGTTLTVVATLGLDLTIAHVGDSRAYLMRNGELSRLTKDQTLVQELVDAGALSPENARLHPQRHVLTGALTASDRPLHTELVKMHLEDGDSILVCSDGLTSMVPDNVIAEVLKDSNPVQSECDELIQLALEGGGLDNVTVALARYTKIAGK